MIKTTKRDLQKSIAHWEDKMLAWAEKQPKRGQVSVHDMNDAIREEWHGPYCALCKRIRPDLNDKCAGCILFESGYGCDKESSLWMKIDNSKTWGKWCKNARKFIAIMKGLL